MRHVANCYMSSKAIYCPSGLKVVTVAIKKSEFVPDAPYVPLPPGPPPPPPSPRATVPIYQGGDVPTGPGGGRADAPGGTTGDLSALDIYDQGNNPFMVSARARELLRQEIIVAAEEAARVATEQAVLVRTPPC